MNPHSITIYYHLVVANVRDSRAVICSKNGVAKQLSVDHNTYNQMEHTTIYAKGGSISKTLNEVNEDFKLTRELIWCLEDDEIYQLWTFFSVGVDRWWHRISCVSKYAIKKIKNPKKAVEHLLQLTLNNNMKKFIISYDISCIVVRFGWSINECKILVRVKFQRKYGSILYL